MALMALCAWLRLSRLLWHPKMNRHPNIKLPQAPRFEERTQFCFKVDFAYASSLSKILIIGVPASKSSFIP